MSGKHVSTIRGLVWVPQVKLFAHPRAMCVMLHSPLRACSQGCVCKMQPDNLAMKMEKHPEQKQKVQLFKLIELREINPLWI